MSLNCSDPNTCARTIIPRAALIFREIMVRRTNFPGILVPRTEIFAGPKFPRQPRYSGGPGQTAPVAPPVGGTGSPLYFTISSHKCELHSQLRIKIAYLSNSNFVSMSRTSCSSCTVSWQPLNNMPSPPVHSAILLP